MGGPRPAEPATSFGGHCLVCRSYIDVPFVRIEGAENTLCAVAWPDARSLMKVIHLWRAVDDSLLGWCVTEPSGYRLARPVEDRDRERISIAGLLSCGRRPCHAEITPLRRFVLSLLLSLMPLPFLLLFLLLLLLLLLLFLMILLLVLLICFNTLATPGFPSPHPPNPRCRHGPAAPAPLPPPLPSYSYLNASPAFAGGGAPSHTCLYRRLRGSSACSGWRTRRVASAVSH